VTIDIFELFARELETGMEVSVTKENVESTFDLPENDRGF
jgi:hypothetical protein